MKEPIKDLDALWNLPGSHISPEIKKTISTIGLSAGLLLGGNGGFKNEAQAQMGISPTPLNQMMSPYYNTNDTSKFSLSLQELEKNSLNLLLNSNTGLQEEDIRRINPIFIDYLVRVFESKETIEGMNFFSEILELGKNNKISEQQVSEIIKVYIRNGFIPKNVVVGALQGIQEFYSQEEFLFRISKIQALLKTKTQLTPKDIRPIFKEYLDELEAKNEKQKEVIILIILGVFGITGLIEFGRYYLTKDDKK